jgi:type III pantothenate kinase
MLLAIDIGNTNIVVALFKGDDLLHTWRIYSDTRRTGDEYSTMLGSLMRNSGLTLSDVRSSVLSSVVPILTGPWVGMIEQFFGKKPLIVEPAIFPQLPITVPESAVTQIGSDLVCNAVEAYSRFRGPTIVVDFGTALTFTAIDSGGTIQGVNIAPGIGTAMVSLFENTALLPSVPLVAPTSCLGKNTIHSIQAGVILGYKGLVEYLVPAMKTELAALDGLKPADIHVIATGGLNSVLQPITNVFGDVDKQLTLLGLKRISEIVRPEETGA